jgi:hypothetical protein
MIETGLDAAKALGTRAMGFFGVSYQSHPFGFGREAAEAIGRGTGRWRTKARCGCATGIAAGTWSRPTEWYHSTCRMGRRDKRQAVRRRADAIAPAMTYYEALQPR